MLCVAGSISQKIGVMPCHSSAWAVATNVNDGTMTSPMSSVARIAIPNPMVALHTATQCFARSNWLSLCSNSWTYGPLLVSQCRSKAPVMRSHRRCRSPMFGLPTCNRSANAGRPPKMARSSSRFLITLRANFSHHLSWKAVREDAPGDVMRDESTGTDEGACTDPNVIRNDRSNPNPGAAPDGHATSQMYPRAKVGAVLDDAFVIDTRRRVDDHIFADDGPRIHDGTRRNDGPVPHRHAGGNRRSRVNGCSQ